MLANLDFFIGGGRSALENAPSVSASFPQAPSAISARGPAPRPSNSAFRHHFFWSRVLPKNRLFHAPDSNQQAKSTTLSIHIHPLTHARLTRDFCILNAPFLW
jgi:hypothetical protein